MIVYAKKEGTIIWSDNNKTHKAGRVPIHTMLIVLSVKAQAGWYSIKRPLRLSLEPNPKYPDYWVRIEDTVTSFEEEPPPPLVGVTDEDAAQAILTLLKWLKGESDD